MTFVREWNASGSLATVYPPGPARAAVPPRWREVAIILRSGADAGRAQERLLAAGFGAEAMRLAEAPPCLSGPVSALDPALEALWGRVSATGGGAVPSAHLRGEWPERRFRYAGIGCRRADPGALAFARETGEILSRDALLVSGGAPGCDAAFASGAAEASVAVLPAGLDVPFGEGTYGARLSPFAPEEGFSSVGAMRRNSLIAAAASLVLVASTRLGEGGSWHAAVAALRSRRRVGAYVGPGAGEGAAALAALGAVPVRNAEEAARLAALASELPAWEDLGAIWRECGYADLRSQPRLALSSSLVRPPRGRPTVRSG